MFNHNKINRLIENMQSSKKGTSINKMAHEMGISLSTLNKYKSGSTMPGVENLLVIAKYFGKDMNYFFDDYKETTGGDLVAEEPIGSYEKKNPWELLYEKQEEITELKCEIERLKNANAEGSAAQAG